MKESKPPCPALDAAKFEADQREKAFLQEKCQLERDLFTATVCLAVTVLGFLLAVSVIIRKVIAA